MQSQVGFKVWGKIAGDVFEKVFPTVTAWQAWRRLNERRYEIEVHGMKSEAV
ncbi:hypothetical protein Brsp06_03473 [Brucella sp. NBRC 13694]|uniref:hypothetical protein n=1 Tax=Brucella sp. NBRC 13694 TaxID=3075482 RepID=UPI00241E3365|nr:hypothetical protein [Brucella anthropi]